MEQTSKKQTGRDTGGKPVAEPYILMGYYLAIPASLASQVLPHLIRVETDYKDGTTVRRIGDDEIDLKILDMETVAGMFMAKRLKGAGQ